MASRSVAPKDGSERQPGPTLGQGDAPSSPAHNPKQFWGPSGRSPVQRPARIAVAGIDTVVSEGLAANVRHFYVSGPVGICARSCRRQAHNAGLQHRRVYRGDSVIINAYTESGCVPGQDETTWYRYPSSQWDIPVRVWLHDERQPAMQPHLQVAQNPVTNRARLRLVQVGHRYKSHLARSCFQTRISLQCCCPSTRRTRRGAQAQPGQTKRAQEFSAGAVRCH